MAPIKTGARGATARGHEASTSKGIKGQASTKVRVKSDKSPSGKIDLRVERTKIPLNTRTIVLTEAGYRCAVPTCRTILALDMHHMYQVAYGGGDTPSNLIALCPTCHSLYHRGFISTESIYIWKSMLVAICRAFDLEAVDRLLFLEPLEEDFLVVTGDGLLHFSRLIAAGLADMKMNGNNNGLIVTYAINISERGKMLISAWRDGDRVRLKQMMGGPVPGAGSSGEFPQMKKQ